MKAAGAKDLRRERQLLLPVGDDRPAKEALRPFVHLGGDLFSDGEKRWIVINRELEVALIVERHRRHLAERVLAVEHPAIRAAQQRVCNVAKSDLERHAGTRRRARALDPLAAEIVRDITAGEVAGARITNGNRGPADG